jgi:hypothetical protein
MAVKRMTSEDAWDVQCNASVTVRFRCAIYVTLYKE